MLIFGLRHVSACQRSKVLNGLCTCTSIAVNWLTFCVTNTFQIIRGFVTSRFSFLKDYLMKAQQDYPMYADYADYSKGV